MPLLTGDLEFSHRTTVMERKTGLGPSSALESNLLHKMETNNRYTNGTGSNKQDSIYTASISLSGASNIDLRGALNSQLDGSTVSFPIVTHIEIRNNSTVSGSYLTVGASTTPFITWLAASGDGIRVGPGGTFILDSPIDGYATTPVSADVLTLTSAVGTISVDILISGRAS